MVTYAQFLAIPDGTRIFNHGYDQCVALANHYNEGVLGGQFVPVGSAYQWWTSYSALPQLHQRFKQSATPVSGAIFVARYGIYNAPDGHIGVVTSVNSDGTFNTMEQNAGTWRYVGRYTRSTANVLGFLIPVNNPAGGSGGSISSEDDSMLFKDQSGVMYVADELGFAKISDISPSADNGEMVYAARAVFNSGKGEVTVNARQRDLINSIGRNRWARIKAEIVKDVVAKVAKPTVDTAAIAKAVAETIGGLPGGSSIDAKVVEAAAKAGAEQALAAITLKAVK